MKTIGLIGGMSWQSTLDYYRIINDYVARKLGDLHSANIILSSIDFYHLEKLQRNHRWEEAAKLILAEAKRLERASADLILICSNTGNESVGRIKDKVSVPIVHIADVVGARAKELEISKLALLGTIYTMENNYIREALEEKFGLEIVVPNKKDRVEINRMIYRELCLGQIRSASKRFLRRVIEKMKKDGAEAVILGCTEIPLLIKQSDCDIPVLDSTYLHAVYAAKLSLQSE
ncbi:MAG: aspartate/glutamate racemase family protein [Patescibacteria group bacterium]